MPMSWCSGSQVTSRRGVFNWAAVKICSTLVRIDRLVNTTPAGTRVEPEVYCRKAVKSTGSLPLAARNCWAAGFSRGLVKLSARESGRESTDSTRGRSRPGMSAKNVRTAPADRALVSTALGAESEITALRWSAWPGSLGSYNGTGTMPAYMAPNIANTYSGELLARMATRSPMVPTCCNLAATALMRVLIWSREYSTISPSRDCEKSQNRKVFRPVVPAAFSVW